MINNPLVTISLIMSGILMLVFIFYPGLDITISEFFYYSEIGFKYKNQAVIQFFFRIVPALTKLFVAICFLYMIYLAIRHKNIKPALRSWAFFLFISAAIAPGLTVNSLLKENFGRARPSQIIEFSGKKEFTPAFIISNQCDTNCSFSSGHAAMGFYFTAIAYIMSTIYFNRIYILGLFFGTFVGVSRIVMGGHFASDVIASAFIVLFLNHIIYLLWKNKILKCKKLQ
ncbi:MAG: phosphatase PAP2 family protein [Rickettsiaceae bacterium]|nr:phosphatase PAP2 family protein [Rickettsiaceae bacterium]